MEFPPPLNLEEERGLPAYVYLCINVHRHWYLSARYLSCSPRSFDYFNSCCGVNYSVGFFCVFFFLFFFWGGGLGVCVWGGSHISLYCIVCVYVCCMYIFSYRWRLFASKFSILVTRGGVLTIFWVTGRLGPFDPPFSTYVEFWPLLLGSDVEYWPPFFQAL